MRVVVIATSLRDGQRWVREQTAPGQAVVITPRTPAACRGWAADEVAVTDNARRSLTDDQLARLRANAIPCLAAGGVL